MNIRILLLVVFCLSFHVQYSILDRGRECSNINFIIIIFIIIYYFFFNYFFFKFIIIRDYYYML